MDDSIIGQKKCAVLCVIKCKDKMLLLKRIKEPHIGNYIPVGGKIEPCESPEDAAKREAFEEAGIKLQNVKYAGTLVETSPTKYNWIVFVYTCEVDYFEPPACNEGELIWIDLAHITKIPTPTTDLYIYEYIENNKNFMFNAIYNNDVELVEMQEEIENRKIYSR